VSTGEAPVDIVPYDEAWPGRFEEERRKLLDTIGPWLAGPVEHIGSTAIPGLAAKPVIDIMAGVASLEASRPARPALPALAELDYCYFPYRQDSEHWFCKPPPFFRTHHLHLVPFGSAQWVGAIAFRDYLRTHPEDRRGVSGIEDASRHGISFQQRGVHAGQESVRDPGHRAGAAAVLVNQGPARSPGRPSR